MKFQTCLLIVCVFSMGSAFMKRGIEHGGWSSGGAELSSGGWQNHGGGSDAAGTLEIASAGHGWDSGIGEDFGESYIEEHGKKVKIVKIPVPHAIPVAVPHKVAIPVPQPYPVTVQVPQRVEVPVVKTVEVPVEKHVPIHVEKIVPYPVEKPFPVHIEKHIPVPVEKPYPVKVPVVKYIYHHVGKHQHSGGHGHHH